MYDMTVSETMDGLKQPITAFCVGGGGSHLARGWTTSYHHTKSWPFTPSKRREQAPSSPFATASLPTGRRLRLKNFEYQLSRQRIGINKKALQLPINGVSILLKTRSSPGHSSRGNNGVRNQP